MFDAQESEGEDVEDDENDSASDVEIDEMEGYEDDVENAEDTTDSDSGSSSEGDVDQDELIAFESKLAAALGTRRGDEDLNASDGESSSDEDMDDEQMENLDEKLVEIFKARQVPLNKKKEKKDAKEMMIHFKGRVLGLLEVYIKHQHSNELVLNLVIPLLRLIRTTKTKHIANKSCHLIRELAKQVRKKGLIQLNNPDSAWDILEQVHHEAGIGGSNAFATACGQSSLLVVKVLVGHNKEAVSRVVDVYGETRKRQLQNKKCQVQPSFFTEWNNWCASASQQLRT